MPATFPPITPLPIFDWTPKPIRDQGETINARIAALTQSQSEYLAKVAAIREQSLEDIDPGSIERSNEFRRWMIELLKEEVGIREDMRVYVSDVEACVKKAEDKARDQVEKKKEKIKQQLLDLGYVDTGTYRANVPGSIMPGPMINGHPSVVEARNAASQFNPNGTLGAVRHQIDAAQQFIEQQFERFKNDATGGQ